MKRSKPLLTLIVTYVLPLSQALFVVQDSETREVKSLDGIWHFTLGDSLDPELGFREKWFNQSLKETGARVLDMPVPSSFNDITTDQSVRDYVGWVWYETDFFLPSSWATTTTGVRLRFGSAHFTAIVWVNGQEVVRHVGGHLPFEADVTEVVAASQSNRITVALNNTLSEYSIPQGKWHWKEESNSYPAGYFTMDYTFDFFNYAGIHRPVKLFTVPKTIVVEDVTITSTVSPDLTQSLISYEVSTSSSNSKSVLCNVELVNEAGEVIATMQSCSDTFALVNPQLWWPVGMSSRPGYLHTLKVTALNGEAQDVYRQKFGIREVSWTSDSFKINHQDFYFRGFGWHEDGNIRGKGLDLAKVAKDFNLFKWSHANSFRTSHYPYAEEILDFADRNGIVIIDECPGVNLEGFELPLMDNHKQVMTELVQRDKNRPSVVMWSIANEARSTPSEARDYFQQVADHTRALDPSRPITLATAQPEQSDQAPYAVDIIMINKYFSWYSDTGHLELVQRQMERAIQVWRQQHNKPVMVSEYGSDTINGFHEVPATIFTEEYQTEMMSHCFKAFDNATNQGGFIGEHIWNFADFMTKQEYTRAWGNRKGVFTRDRHPKASAHLLRDRYASLESHQIADSVMIEILDK